VGVEGDAARTDGRPVVDLPPWKTVDWRRPTGPGVWALDRYDGWLERNGDPDQAELPARVVAEMMFLELDRSPDAVAAERQRRRERD
jgi:hypothetical protein